MFIIYTAFTVPIVAIYVPRYIVHPEKSFGHPPHFSGHAVEGSNCLWPHRRHAALCNDWVHHQGPVDDDGFVSQADI